MIKSGLSISYFIFFSLLFWVPLCWSGSNDITSESDNLDRIVSSNNSSALLSSSDFGSSHDSEGSLDRGSSSSSPDNSAVTGRDKLMSLAVSDVPPDMQEDYEILCRKAFTYSGEDKKTLSVCGNSGNRAKCMQLLCEAVRLYVAKSNIAAAGKGVFAGEYISKGKMLGVFAGETRTGRCKDNHQLGYTIMTERGEVDQLIVPHKHLHRLSYVNWSDLPNVAFCGNPPVMYALCPIFPNAELLFDYNLEKEEVLRAMQCKASCFNNVGHTAIEEVLLDQGVPEGDLVDDVSFDDDSIDPGFSTSRRSIKSILGKRKSKRHAPAAKRECSVTPYTLMHRSFQVKLFRMLSHHRPMTGDFKSALIAGMEEGAPSHRFNSHVFGEYFAHLDLISRAARCDDLVDSIVALTTLIGIKPEFLRAPDYTAGSVCIHKDKTLERLLRVGHYLQRMHRFDDNEATLGVSLVLPRNIEFFTQLIESILFAPLDDFLTDVCHIKERGVRSFSALQTFLKLTDVGRGFWITPVSRGNFPEIIWHSHIASIHSPYIKEDRVLTDSGFEFRMSSCLNESLLYSEVELQSSSRIMEKITAGNWQSAVKKQQNKKEDWKRFFWTVASKKFKPGDVVDISLGARVLKENIRNFPKILQGSILTKCNDDHFYLIKSPYVFLAHSNNSNVDILDYPVDSDCRMFLVYASRQIEPGDILCMKY